MKKKHRRLLVLVIATMLFSDVSSLAKILIILPITLLLLIDYDNFTIDLLKEGKEI